MKLRLKGKEMLSGRRGSEEEKAFSRQRKQQMKGLKKRERGWLEPASLRNEAGEGEGLAALTSLRAFQVRLRS